MIKRGPSIAALSLAFTLATTASAEPPREASPTAASAGAPREAEMNGPRTNVEEPASVVAMEEPEPFYASPWFWGAAAAFAAVGLTVFLVTSLDDDAASSDTIPFRATIPPAALLRF